MEISQITGAGKDPVARVEDDKQLKNIGSIPAVQAVKNDQDSKQSKPELPEAPSFEHLRQQPLHLLLRVINARLTQTFGVTHAPAPRNFMPDIEQALTPEGVSARVLSVVSTALERFKTQDINAEILLATFLRLASESLNQAAEESRGVLNNLNLLDDPAAAQIDKTITLIHTALARFSS